MTLQNSFTKENLANFLIFLIPISYIAGNLVLNLNILILIVYIFFVYRLEVFKNKLSFIDKLILLFFLYLQLNGIFNNFFNFDYPNAKEQNIVFIKSILFMRFLLLYFVLKFLIINNIINFKVLFLVFGTCSLFVGIDLIFQFYFGKDVFGFEGGGRRLAGPFGDEYIAGSFIQRFFIFLIFFLLIFKNLKEKKIGLYFFLPIIIFLSLFGVLFSGNRIPLVLCLLMLGLLFFYQKSLRKIFGIFFVLFLLSFTYLINSNKNILHHFNTFKARGYQTLEYIITRVADGEVSTSNTYIKEIESGILTWQENIYFGGGIKSFFWNCNSIDREKMLKFVTKKGSVNCNTHPHNYYLEIGSELGLAGIVLVITIFLTIILKSLKLLHFTNHFDVSKKLIVPFFIIFIVEIFPLKTTGSFFTTTNSTFLFIIIAFIVGLIECKKLQKLS